ncbi:MAG: right-handed parallel beta-helix repeat-containing protein, partial [Saprospiraceae bacterium]
NWPIKQCPTLVEPVIEIHTSHPIILTPWDIPPLALPNYPGCPIDTGKIVVTNHIASLQNSPIIDTLIINQGALPYILKGGVPNLAIPHTKNIVFDVFDGVGNHGNLIRKLIVEGNRSRESTFTTISPKFPLYILRDPPGDKSFSQISNGETFTTSSSISSNVSNNVNVYLQAVLDLEFKDNAKIWGNIGGSFEYQRDDVSSTTAEITTTSTSTFSTSDLQFAEAIGEEADVYVTAAFNMKYSISDVLRLNQLRCEVKRTEELTIDPDTFATQVIYSQYFIRTNLIPGLRHLKDLSTHPDSIRFFNNQISIWESTLRHNEELKETGTLIENLSFDGNVGAIMKESQIDSTTSRTIEWTENFDTGFYISFGGVFEGFGAEGGVGYNHQWSFSEANTTETSKNVNFSYTLDDDDTNDFYTVDVLKDTRFPTLFFKAVAAETSCPYEKGTLSRHGATLTSDFISQYDIPANQSATYVLTLTNNSEAGTSMAYFLDFNGPSNVNNAIVSWDLQFESVQILQPFESRNFILSISKNPANQFYSHEGIEFRVFPGCSSEDGSYSPDLNNALADVKLNAYFESPCSQITIEEPDPNWVVSQETNEELNIMLKDYDKNNMSSLKIEYSPEGTSNWQTGINIPISNLNDNANIGSSFLWNTSGTSEGNYKIRAVVNCPSVVNYTANISGHIDNTSPFSIGYPFPEDHRLTHSNFIGIDLNENLSTTIDQSNVTLTNSLTGVVYDTDVNITNNRMFVNPHIDLVNLPPASYNITFFGLKDAYLNPLIDTVKWWFTVGDYNSFSCDTTKVYYVDNSLNKAFTVQDGSSWEDAFVDLDKALQAACPGSSIYIAQGIYNANDTMSMNGTIDEDAFFEVTHSYHLFGGFPSGGADFEDRNGELYPTIISGDNNNNGIPDQGDAHTLFFIRDNLTCHIEGLIFENTYADVDDVFDPTSASGAIYNLGDVEVTNCVFRHNRTTNSNGVGAAWFNRNESTPKIVNCLFYDNVANSSGGAIGAFFGDLKIINCTFSKNISPNSGVFGANNANVDFINCIFYHNNITLENFDKTNLNSKITIYHSSFENDFPVEAIDGGGNIVFNNPDFEDELNDDFRIMSTSNIIDKGINIAIDTIQNIDLSYAPRILDVNLNAQATVDMGAYEISPCGDVTDQTALYVDQSVTSNIDGFTWNTAFNNLSKAVLKANTCGLDTIYIAQGLYLPNSINPSDSREATFYLNNGLKLFGGFPSGGGVRDINQNITILSGNIGDSTLVVDNAYTVVTIQNGADTTTVDGLMIMDGYANGPFNKSFGGGIRNEANGYGMVSCPVISNCIIKN